MQNVEIFITSVLNIIMGFFGHELFMSSILYAIFLFWLIRQIVNVFKMIVWSLFK